MSVPSESTELEVLISNPIGEAPHDKERKVPDEDALSRLLRFGPVYGEDTKEAHRLLKDAAWQHILSRTSGGDDGDETLKRYLDSIEPLELRVIDAYDNKVSEKLSPGKAFRTMMAKDGCCFLQLALHILGAGELLGYSPLHPYLGKYSDPCKFIPDMFFFGNHIPYPVIDALMKQDFFKDVIGSKWRRPSDGDVVKLALYQLVVEPQLTREGKKVAGDFSIVTALRNVLLGSNTDDYPSDAAVRRRWWYRDLEDGMHKDNNRVHFPSATELKRSGVKLRKAKGGDTIKK